MNMELFVSTIRNLVPVGTVFINPGGGTSEILKITEHAMTYRRGHSRMSISFENLFKAYLSFRGKQVSTSDLKLFKPSIFDSQARPAGHSCHGTFLFLLLLHLGFTDKINGHGVRGDPFFIDIS
jgi:hypothetical protein